MIPRVELPFVVIILCAQLLLQLSFTEAQPPLWGCAHADASRSNMGHVKGPVASPILIRNVSFPDYGKSHGSPTIDSNGRVFALFWLQAGKYGTPLLRRWDADGSVHDVALPALGSDIIEDSNDPLLISAAGIAYITFSYYNPSVCFNCTSLFAVRCDDGAILWSVDYHPFIDSMAILEPAASSNHALLVMSSQSRQLILYDAVTGKQSAATSLYASISDRSSMAVSSDGAFVVIQERDDTFGHNKLAAYRCLFDMFSSLIVLLTICSASLPFLSLGRLKTHHLSACGPRLWQLRRITGYSPSTTA
jgi:hypothetical protein